jgi:hypothetical protein
MMAASCTEKSIFRGGIAAHLNFEVKAGTKCRCLRRPGVLEFKVEMRFSAAVR